MKKSRNTKLFRLLIRLAEEVGFEPTVPLGTTVFKTAAFNHSAIPPSDAAKRIAHLRNKNKTKMNFDDITYMKRALLQAKRAAELDEVPIGAVVVYEGRVIAQAYNRRELDRDPAGHAEFIAMKRAAHYLGAWRLSGCTVYVTLEPCLMCAGLMYQSRIDRCVFGAFDPKAGALGSLYRINEDTRLNHMFEVEGGVEEQMCAQLLKDFFVEKRAQRKKNKTKC